VIIMKCGWEKVVMEVGIKGILQNTMQATKMKIISTKMVAVAVVNLNFSVQCRQKSRKTSHVLVACFVNELYCGHSVRRREVMLQQ